MYQNRILNVLNDMGILVVKDQEEDINLQDYITDSLQFITFIIELEKALEIEFPDELLLYENIRSLDGLASLIEEILKNAKNEQISPGKGGAI